MLGVEAGGDVPNAALLRTAADPSCKEQMIPRSKQMIDEKDRQTLDDALLILKRAMNKEAAALITKDQVSPQGLIATEFAENLAKLQAGIEALEKRRG